MTQQQKVTFEPQGRCVSVPRGTTLSQAALRAGLTIQTPCGGAGTCGKCRVQVTLGVCEATPHEMQHLSHAELSAHWRLACQSRVQGDMVVHVPDTSLLASEHQILAQRQEQRAEHVLPAVRKVYVQLAQPTLGDCDADLLRLERQIGHVKADLATLRELSARMRQGQFSGTAVLADHHLIDFEPGDTTACCYGLAVDIGTTTLVASLLDLANGHELALAAAINPQTSLGDDVISRIARASAPAGLQELRSAITDAVNNLIAQLCQDTGASRECIYEVAFAGNTTMEHLLCGIDPTQLGQLPFVPVHGHGLFVPAAELGIAIHPRGLAYILPVIGGFVGGDTVAGIVAAKLGDRHEPTLMVDIGTNGEIALSAGGRLLASSTAAGPAFEGARIGCGMRATRGAIEKVVIEGDQVRCGVIGNAAAVGLCGSGLIDAAAELLRVGIVSEEGLMRSADDLPADLPAALRRRVVTREGGQGEFVLTDDGAPQRLTLTQRDIRELQLAAGAIRAGIFILLKQAGLSPGDLAHVLIAGGFGSYIRKHNAQRIGLLPPEIAPDRISHIGNASLAGCRLALLSTDVRKQAEELARRTRHVELSLDMDFQMLFAEAMIFPQQDRG